jgi:hypothetical protein
MITESQAYLLIKCRKDSTRTGLDGRALNVCIKKGFVAIYSLRATFSVYYTLTSAGLEAIKEYGDAGKTAFGIRINLEKFDKSSNGKEN